MFTMTRRRGGRGRSRKAAFLAVASAAALLTSSASGFQSSRLLLPSLPPTQQRRAGTAASAATSSVAALRAFPEAASAASAVASTSLSASNNAVLSALSSLESPLGSVTVLALVIVVHELGHFLAARSLGISVREFSVGVGPRLAGFQRRVGGSSDSGDASGSGKAGKVTKSAVSGNEVDDDDDDAEVIDFNLRAIPFGGYVRFPENYNSTLAFEIEESNRALRKEQRAARRREELSKRGTPALGADGRDAADMVMGASESTPSGFLRFLTLGDTVTGRDRVEEEKMRRRKAEEKARAAAEKAAKKGPAWKSWFGAKSKKEEKDIDPLKQKPQEIEYYDDPDLLQNRPWFQRAIVLSGGVAFNVALAFACYFGELTVGTGLPKPVFDNGAVITQNPRGDGAGYGVLKRGDVIIGVNGDPITRSVSPRVSEAQDDISRFIARIRTTEPGDSLKLSILRPTSDIGPYTKSADIERRPAEVSVTPRPLKNEGGESAGPMSIGVMLAPNYQRTDVVKADNVIDAAAKAGVAVGDITSDTARSIFQLLGGLLTGKGPPAGQSVSGPVGVLKAGSDVVSTNDFRAVVGFAAAVSINLAVINSLPLPALDGGQLAFVLAEAATGRKIDQRLQENINAAVLLLLLLVSVGTTIGDVEAIALGR